MVAAVRAVPRKQGQQALPYRARQQRAKLLRGRSNT